MITSDFNVDAMSKRPPPSVVAANQATKFEPDASGTFLRAWRKKRGLSQEKLGAAAGYTQGMVSQWEKGDVALDLVHIAKLSKALEITPKELQFRHPDVEEGIEDIFDDLGQPDQVRIIEIARTMRRIGDE